ncbi:MAG TPA: hypothetical protein VHD32_15245 [Candidatus Didemnitutus sp.]|nr:hypothetical protein [Candidatus Didemnitutus sp.]
MLHAVVTEIRCLWHSVPGDRFHARYRRVRQRKEPESVGPRMVRIVLAVICFLIGTALLFLPVPEFPFFILGGALLAAESSWLARLLDRLELRIRVWIARGKAKWRVLPTATKGIVGAVVFSALCSELYFFCRLCVD